MSRLTIVAMCVAGAMAAGCQHSMDLPATFVQLAPADARPYELRAVSADGAVIALRVQDNGEHGTLEFWSQAVQNELAGRGYKLADARDVTGESCRPGRLMEFTTVTSGQEFTYLTALFVGSRGILVTEAGGKSETLRPKMDDVKKALLTAR